MLRIASDHDDIRHGLAPRATADNAFTIGCVPEVNGPQSERKTIPVSRFEAMLLVQHWLGELLAIEWDYEDYGTTGSTEWRTSLYAHRRIDELIDAGMVTAAEVDREAAALQTQRREGSK